MAPGAQLSFDHFPPLGPGPGSYEACVGNLSKTGFNKTAADMIRTISEAERISTELLAVTWMNESSFQTHPLANDNGRSDDINKWDVGPFQINIYWTLRAAEKNEVSELKNKLTRDTVYREIRSQSFAN